MIWLIAFILIFFLLKLGYPDHELFRQYPPHCSSHYYDQRTKTKLHGYPFSFYSLYGYDDCYPTVNYKNPIVYDYEWYDVKARRRHGKKYWNQIPSYNQVRQLGV